MKVNFARIIRTVATSYYILLYGGDYRNAVANVENADPSPDQEYLTRAMEESPANLIDVVPSILAVRP